MHLRILKRTRRNVSKGTRTSILLHFLPFLVLISYVLQESGIPLTGINIVERGCKVHSPVKLACGESSAKFREDPKYTQEIPD